uniref:Uncharacterized protein n=1 Tax=Mustela putorius furo TaxID=9669 RepID=M3Z811_MUSPF
MVRSSSWEGCQGSDLCHGAGRVDRGSPATVGVGVLKPVLEGRVCTKHSLTPGEGGRWLLKYRDLGFSPQSLVAAGLQRAGCGFPCPLLSVPLPRQLPPPSPAHPGPSGPAASALHFLCLWGLSDEAVVRNQSQDFREKTWPSRCVCACGSLSRSPLSPSDKGFPQAGQSCLSPLLAPGLPPECMRCLPGSGVGALDAWVFGPLGREVPTGGSRWPQRQAMSCSAAGAAPPPFGGAEDAEALLGRPLGSRAQPQASAQGQQEGRREQQDVLGGHGSHLRLGQDLPREGLLLLSELSGARGARAPHCFCGAFSGEVLGVISRSVVWGSSEYCGGRLWAPSLPAIVSLGLLGYACALAGPGSLPPTCPEFLSGACGPLCHHPCPHLGGPCLAQTPRVRQRAPPFPAAGARGAFFLRAPLVGLLGRCREPLVSLSPSPVRSALLPRRTPSPLCSGRAHGVLEEPRCFSAWAPQQHVGCGSASRVPPGFCCTRLPGGLAALDSRALTPCSALPTRPRGSLLASCLLRGRILCAPESWHFPIPPDLCVACPFISLRSLC